MENQAKVEKRRQQLKSAQAAFRAKEKSKKQEIDRTCEEVSVAILQIVESMQRVSVINPSMSGLLGEWQTGLRNQVARLKG